MAERNRNVPFPESEMFGNGDLEKYLFEIAEGRLFDYAALPTHITAVGIEHYANWLAALTKEDPHHNERGAYIHVRMDSKGLIYPSNPDVGYLGVTPVPSKNRSRFFPALCVHTHPDNQCFSHSNGNGWGDLDSVIVGYGKGEEYIRQAASLVATTDGNYLLLRTNQTEHVDGETLYGLIFDSLDLDTFLQYRRYGNRYGESMESRRYLNYLKGPNE